jgi:pimeloyl-ACP methyl ester carboxylesterase
VEREYTLEVPTPLGDEEIALCQRSEGRHRFIAWHGITATNRFWYWDTFWEQGQVTLAGLPGHGPVRRHPRDHYLRWTAQHLIDVGVGTARHLYNGEPMTLIGHSTGGLIALGVALAAPELVARLILLAPVVWGELSGIIGLWLRVAERPALARLLIGASLAPGRWSYRLFRASLRSYVSDAQGLYGNPRLDSTLRYGYPHYRLTSTDAVLGTVLALRTANLRPGVLHRCPTIPTLLVHGDRDGVVPYRQSAWLVQALPQASLVTVPGVGHMAYVESEQWVSEQVNAWCAEHPA